MSDSFVIPWTVTHQAPLSMGFSRQEFWSGLPFPSPGDLPDPGIKSPSSASQVDSSPWNHQGTPFTFLVDDNILSPALAGGGGVHSMHRWLPKQEMILFHFASWVPYFPISCSLSTASPTSIPHLTHLLTARRSNQSILKEIHPEYSLEGLMLKLKL